MTIDATTFYRNQRVRKDSGDYSWEGVVRGVVRTHDDGPERVVVAHPVERGFVLHIYSPAQLVRLPPILESDA